MQVMSIVCQKCITWNLSCIDSICVYRIYISSVRQKAFIQRLWHLTSVLPCINHHFLWFACPKLCPGFLFKCRNFWCYEKQLWVLHSDGKKIRNHIFSTSSLDSRIKLRSSSFCLHGYDQWMDVGQGASVSQDPQNWQRLNIKFPVYSESATFLMMSISRISFVPLVHGLKHHIRSQETSPKVTWHWVYFAKLAHRPLALPLSPPLFSGPVDLWACCPPVADSYRSRENSITHWAATYLSLFILCVVYKAFSVTFPFSSKTILQNQKVKDNSLRQFHLCRFKDVWLWGSTYLAYRSDSGSILLIQMERNTSHSFHGS